uniref:Uncharacterized protein n=1 Tax=viral metagenome TaxID=1070528 RepID=A0A6C0H561_9ZZZZ
MDKPKLVDPITKVYLNNILKTIHETNVKHKNIIYNLYLIMIMIVVFGLILYYLYNEKLNKGDKEEEKRQKKEELLNMIYYYQQEAKKKEYDIFTKLPIWKNEYDKIEHI